MTLHAPRIVPLWLWLMTVPGFSLPAPGSEGGPLRVEPAVVRLDGGRSQWQVVVSRQEADGAFRDLTREARYTLSPPGIASVGGEGVVRPIADGRAVLRIEAEGQAVDVPVEVTRASWVRPSSFRHDVTALLSKAGCNSGPCHGNINGKGGFRLSLRNDDPAFDRDALTRDLFGRRVDRADPARSLIYLKPTGQVAHEGGLRFGPDSPESRALLDWIAAGAGDDAETAAALVGVSVFPSERRLAAPGLGQQLIVTAEFADGSHRDVTRQATYEVNDPTRVSVTPDGRVEAQGPGEAVVAVRYLQGRGVSRLAFLHDRPHHVGRDLPVKSDLDRAVFDKLQALRIQPSEPVSDPVFLRRAYLDAIGVLPTVEEARAFLADTRPDKRARLVDRLLARDEFADFWALKWADLLRNEEKTMGEKGAWVFQRWLRDQIAADRPLSEFARDLLTARGSTWRNPPASFYRTNRDPQTAAETLGQVFLGVRLQCARCHNHPFDVWTQDDYYGLAAAFANIGHKEVNNVRRDRLDKHEINGDEIIYLEGPPRMVQPRSGTTMAPKAPGGPTLDVVTRTNALDSLADWLTQDNPQFARNLANRIWYHVMGRGIVDPVDDFRDSNPPSNPALLDALTAEFVRHGLRLRPVVRAIMTSTVYELGSRPDETNAEDEANFARAAVKLLPAEVLLDAIGQALDSPARFPNTPAGTRAVQLSGVKMGGEFLRVFGKPERLLTCECERSEATTLAQAFQLINGEAVRALLTAESNRIGRLIGRGAEDEELLEELYLASLSRRPTQAERDGALGYLSRASDRRRAWEDVAWALINSKEFLLRH
jgi:hypothetical protein